MKKQVTIRKIAYDFYLFFKYFIIILLFSIISKKIIINFNKII